MPSRGLVVALALGAAAVAAVALAFALARQPDYRAEAVAVAVERETLRPRIDAAYMAERLADGRAELEVRLERGSIDPRLVDGVELADVPAPAGVAGAVAVSARAPTPDRAAELVRLVLLQIDALSSVELEATARGELREARAARAAAPTPARRRAVERRIAGLHLFLAAPRARFGALEVRVERPTRWADRLVASLPGPFSPRPQPVWAAFAGALIGAALAAAAAALAGRSRRRPA